MNGIVTNKIMFGVCILSLLMMSSAGCIADDDKDKTDDEVLKDCIPDGQLEIYDGSSSEVTLKIYHGSSFEDALAKYTIVIELNHDLAPLHADNFRTHVLDCNYDGVNFHRIIDDFMIQGGDFENNDGTGGYAAKWYGICNGEETSQSDCPDPKDYNVPDEADNTLTHLPCTISMAKTSAPDSGGSQFFLMPDDITQHTWLDGVHTVFGTVTSGCEHITTISELETGQNDRPVLPVIIYSAIASPSMT